VHLLQLYRIKNPHLQLKLDQLHWRTKKALQKPCRGSSTKIRSRVVGVFEHVRKMAQTRAIGGENNGVDESQTGQWRGDALSGWIF